MAYLKCSAINRGQTKADDILQFYEDGLFLTKKKDSWFLVNYAIRVNKTVAELRTLLLKPAESDGNPIGDENRFNVKFSSLGLSVNDQNLIRSKDSKSPVPTTNFDFDTVIQDKEK